MRVMQDKFTGDPFKQAFEARKKNRTQTSNMQDDEGGDARNTVRALDLTQSMREPYFLSKSAERKLKGENIMDQFTGDPKLQGFLVRDMSRKHQTQALNIWDFASKDYVGKEKITSEDLSLVETMKGDPFKQAHELKSKARHVKASKSHGCLSSYFGDQSRQTEINKLQRGEQTCIEFKGEPVKRALNEEERVAKFIHPNDVILTR